MKTKSNITSLGIALMLLFTVPAFIHAQGPLDPPPGPPGDTMKTLQELWDKMEALEGQVSGLQEQLGAVTATPGSGFPMEFVDVLDAGNAADPLNSGSVPGIGAVSYAYRIGKYEVTNAQYAAFLNAVAATDTNSLYNASMGLSAWGGITRSGASPNFTYAVKPAMGDKPVNYVNWFSCLRFCNWMHNGRPTGAQGAGTTEGGAYTLTGGTVAAGSDPTHGANGRNTGALDHLPSENEWYKGAYYQPVGQGGDADNYWLYPTRSNGVPTVATADATGNINNDTANIANYIRGADWNGLDGNVTTVGSGGPGSQSFYGAADMGGNVYEWDEQDISGKRGLRGGSWLGSQGDLRSSKRNDDNPTFGSRFNGFRIAGP